MTRMKLVIGQTGGMQCDFTKELPHTTAPDLRLIHPGLRTDRLVCGDSHFASVQTAEVLLRYGVRLTGEVENSFTEFSMHFFGSIKLMRRGINILMISTNGFSEKS